MLVLIVDENLTLCDVSADTSAPFAPAPAAVGRPLRDCFALMDADPDLITACMRAFAGHAPSFKKLHTARGHAQLRRIWRRQLPENKAELIITYVPDPDLSRARLTEMRARLATVMEAETDAYALYDADQKLVLCNAAYANFYPGPEGPLTLGMSFDAVLRRFIAHGGVDLSPDAVETWIAKRKAEGQKPYHKREFRTADGRFFSLIERDALDGGRLRQMIDLTNMRQAERDLHDVVIGAQAGTWSVEAGTGGIRINERFAAILGHELHDLAPFSLAHWRDLMHPDGRDDFDRAWADLQAKRKHRIEVELRLRRRNGSWIWCAVRGGAADASDEEPSTRISGVMLDVTSQHELKTALLRRDAAVTATGDGLFITDETGQIVDANPAMIGLLGLPGPQAVIGRDWAPLFAPASITHLQTSARDILRQTGRWQGEALLRDMQGSDLEVDLTLTEMPDHSVIWMCRDVSARNEDARKLLAMRDSVYRAQRTESVNLIAAGLTHDLTNLVALISHLSDNTLPRDFAEPGAILEEINNAARQMVALLEPIRELGRRQTRREQIAPDALLHEAAGILRIGAPRGLQIDTRIAQDGLRITADRMQLMQVLLNLGLNARDAVGPGAQTITLSLAAATALPSDAKLETGVIPAAPFALFAVSDTGTGMDAATRAHIWEPYFTTKTLGGTGLGLFVVADIVRAAGGGIALATEAGKGTTFYVAWPLDQGA